MFTFMAGATTISAWVARSRVEARSSARGQVVRKAVGHLCEQVRRRRRNDHCLGPVSQGDVIDLALFRGVEELGTDTLARNRLQRERRHELGSRAREDATHLVLRLAEDAYQFGSLVGGDAAGDDD